MGWVWGSYGSIRSEYRNPLACFIRASLHIWKDRGFGRPYSVLCCCSIEFGPLVLVASVPCLTPLPPQSLLATGTHLYVADLKLRYCAS